MFRCRPRDPTRRGPADARSGDLAYKTRLTATLRGAGSKSLLAMEIIPSQSKQDSIVAAMKSVKLISASSVKVEMDEPVVVSMADPAERTWGYWQFPTISRMPGGEILLTVNNNQDDDLCYGHAAPAFLSQDDGATWQSADMDE